MSTKRFTRRQKRQQQAEMDNILNKKFGMKRINPLTENQKKLFNEYRRGKHIANIGSAGTGKTYVSLYLALEDVLEHGEYEKIIIIRSAVQSRDQGFMPGSLKEKQAYFETPYIDAVNDLFGRSDAYAILKQKGMLDFMTTSFVRGLTFDNAIIIVDECQNMNFGEIDSVMTRIGESSRVVFCGDGKWQDDLKTSRNRSDVSGLQEFVRIISKIDEFSLVEFNTEDIVRSGIVKKYIIEKERELEFA
jgi:phosphate starvation-inducible protein PhoH